MESRQYNQDANIKQHIAPLTGLRFIAAALVCLAHIVPYVVPGLDLKVSELAAEGMTLFFVLSGFVIHYNYSASLSENPGRGLYHFFVSRFARLYPLYFFCLCLDLIKLYGYSTLPGSLNESIPYYVTLTQSWIYKPIDAHSLIYQFGLMPSVSWSVSTEWFFYLTYPLIGYGILKSKKINTKVSILLALFILIPFLIFLSYHYQAAINHYAIAKYGPIAGLDHYQDSFYRWLIYFSPYSRITEFIVGCLTASIYMQVSAKRPSKKEERMGFMALIVALLGLVIAHYFIFLPNHSIPSLAWVITLHQCFGFAPFMAVIIFCSARYDNYFSRFLSHPTIQLGGEMSYSVYLLHMPIGEAFSRDAALVTSFIVGMADLSRLFIALLSILGAALISYRLIEVPSRRMIRKYLLIKSDGLNPADSMGVQGAPCESDKK